MIDLRVEVRPRWPLRLPRMGGRDGVLRSRDGVLRRLVRVGEDAVDVRVAQPAPDRVLLGAHAASREAAQEAIARMRFALGVDDDLRAFYDRYRSDPLIGRLVRTDPFFRIRRRPDPWEALAWAVCEQLIEGPRAAAIQRRLVARWGGRCPETGLRLPPGPGALAAVAPAELQACDLAAARAVALRRAAVEVAAGRVDLAGPDHERAWRRLRAIPGIGAWTVEQLALHGQGRFDQVPAGDVGLLKRVGRILTGNPRARVEEGRVRALFAPYGEWAGLASAYVLAAPPHRMPVLA